MVFKAVKHLDDSVNLALADGAHDFKLNKAALKSKLFLDKRLRDHLNGHVDVNCEVLTQPDATKTTFANLFYELELACDTFDEALALHYQRVPLFCFLRVGEVHCFVLCEGLY